MNNNIFSLPAVFILALGVCTSCADGPDAPESDTPNGKTAMTFNFTHPSQTQSRATETSFEAGDAVGLYVSEAAAPLEIAGNTVNNEKITFSGSGWAAQRTLYWDAGEYNVYAYYPYVGDVTSVTDLPIAVHTDQRATALTDGMENYEASDFLFASASKVTASASPVNMQFRHILSKITIRLIKGEDFEGDLPETATVYVHNTVTEATVDLEAGIATRDPRAARKTVMARQTSPTSYSAILIPQRMENRVPLIEVVMNGVSFLYETKFLFKPGTQHIFNLVVDKNPEQVKIEVGGEITNWN